MRLQYFLQYEMSVGCCDLVVRTLPEFSIPLVANSGYLGELILFMFLFYTMLLYFSISHNHATLCIEGEELGGSSQSEVFINQGHYGWPLYLGLSL